MIGSMHLCMIPSFSSLLYLVLCSDYSSLQFLLFSEATDAFLVFGFLSEN